MKTYICVNSHCIVLLAYENNTNDEVISVSLSFLLYRMLCSVVHMTQYFHAEKLVRFLVVCCGLRRPGVRPDVISTRVSAIGS